MDRENNCQECFDKLTDELLGEDFYIVDPVGGNQGREIITQTIIDLYKEKPNLRQRMKFWIKETVSNW